MVLGQRCSSKYYAENCLFKYNLTWHKYLIESSSGSRWKTKQLTYKISKYPSTNRLTMREVDSEIKKALNVWAEVTDLTFEHRLFGKVHIVIVCGFCFARCILFIIHVRLTFCFARFTLVHIDIVHVCLHYVLQGEYWYCPYDVNILLCKVHIDIVHIVLTLCFTRYISTSDLKGECTETEIRLTGWAALLHMRTSR